MLNLVKACVPWLNWKNAGIAALVVGGLMLCTGLANLCILVGVAPLLLVACLVPCLLPLTLLRRKNHAHGIVQLSEQAGQATNSCGCGQEACRIGDGQDSCQSEHVAAETVRS
jgi:hypothetical protein